MAVTLTYTNGDEKTISGTTTYQFRDGFIVLLDGEKQTRMIVQSGHVKEIVFHREEEEAKETQTQTQTQTHSQLSSEEQDHEMVLKWLLQELYNLGINGMSHPTTENTTVDEFTEEEWHDVEQTIKSVWGIYPVVAGDFTLRDVAGVIASHRYHKE